MLKKTETELNETSDNFGSDLSPVSFETAFVAIPFLLCLEIMHQKSKL